jgi:glycosyltransferase involved in cell wall biosynthesis
MKTRLLYVANDRASFAARRLEIVNAAATAGYEVHIALPTSAATAAGRFSDLPQLEAERLLLDSAATLHEIKLTRRGMNPLRELDVAHRLLGLYRRLRPEIVHHFTIKPVLYGTTACTLARVPRIVNSFVGLGYMFDGDDLRSRARRRTLLETYGYFARRSGAVSVFQNPENLKLVLDGARIPRESAVLITGGSGVDLRRFAPGPPEDGPPIVVLPARMLWSKGVAEFVAAAQALRQGGSLARFALVGGADPGNPEAIPMAVLSEWEQSGVVEWWGHQSDMPAVLRRATLVCLPSYAEGVPRCLLEAAATGRPIISTNVPGCREVVTPGVNGILVRPRDAADLAQALAKMLREESLCTMGAASRRIAEERFSIESVVEQTLNIYGKLRTPYTAGVACASPTHA